MRDKIKSLFNLLFRTNYTIEQDNSVPYFYLNLLKIGKYWYFDCTTFIKFKRPPLPVDVCINNPQLNAHLDSISKGQPIIKILVSATKSINSTEFRRKFESSGNIYYSSDKGGVQIMKDVFKVSAYPRTIWVKRVPLFDLVER